jgi:AAA family ATP:ADP antiporter
MLGPVETAAKSTSHPLLSPVERLLKIFADVRPGEGTSAVLLTFNVFLLLLSYYLLKTVREPLILTGGGAEVKTYASAAQSMILLGWVPAYSALATRVSRIKLITYVTFFFVACLLAFYAGALAHVPYLGVAFYIWVGIFNYSIIAQFWGFAADVYSNEQGKRLFAIVGIGSSAGAVAGSYLVKPLLHLLGKGGLYTMMPIAGALLVVCVGFTRVVDRLEIPSPESESASAASKKDEPMGKEGGFALVAKDKYLLLIGALTLLLNWVNTTGEYVLSRTLLAEAEALHLDKDGAERFIGEFTSGYFSWVNVVAVTMQLFVVSRVFKYAGLRVALLIMPLVSLTGYAALTVAPILAFIRVAKIAENSLDYSLQNTTRQALFLPTSREAKYKAKAAIDTFLVRAGDVLSAGLVFVGTTLAFSTKQFALTNVILVGSWLLVALALGKLYTKRVASGPDKG